MSMIYLIGGPPKCGKTTLAKQFSKSVCIPWVSTDTIQNILNTYIPEQDLAILFPSSFIRSESNDEKYSKYSSAEIISAYRTQAGTVYAAIEAFVDSEIADGNDYIIEGFHLEPELIKKLNDKNPNLVRGMILARKDRRSFIDSIHQSTTSNDWIQTRTNDESATFPKIAEMVIDYSNQLERSAQEQDVKVITVDKNFDTQLNFSIEYLLGKPEK
jgi:2-phosphoglycerate kinase